MSEFQEVMKCIQRFCGSQIYCESCPVWNREDMHCKVEHAFHDGELSNDLPEIEHIVMNWAAEHPEPIYPTWVEWWTKEFPNACHDISPCTFGVRERFGCFGQDCDKCRNNPIPADVAEKLGIKPIGGKSDE